MKISNQSRVESRESSAKKRDLRVFCPRPSSLDLRRPFIPQPSTFNPQPVSGFTMVEIAISLAVIGIALVAIIGVLPIGMNTQRDNREETIINQDATVFIEAIRGGARGLDDLTNYVYAITNYWTKINPNRSVAASGMNGYSYGSVSITSPALANYSSAPITNGANIIGLLSTPEFMD